VEYTLLFDSRHKVLLITMGKVLNEATILATHCTVIAAEGPCSGIFDFSAGERNDLSAEFIRSIAQMVPAISEVPLGSAHICCSSTSDLWFEQDVPDSA